MSQTVEEGDLDFRHFRCCGDEDLYPFGCPHCGRLMVFCYECDTLHDDLNDLKNGGRIEVNSFDPSGPIFACPKCAFRFEYYFVRDKKYKTSFDQWNRAGLSHLLKSSDSLPSRSTNQPLGVTTGSFPVDLNAGMIEAVTNPPKGFVSRHIFAETDIALRITSIDWFVQCGEPFSLNLSMETLRVTDWPEAIASCKGSAWENVELEAQNQLTLWLHLNHQANYQKWNKIIVSHKTASVNPLIEKKIGPFQTKNGLDLALVHCVQFDIHGALMENSYLGTGHKAFFFLELFMVYEAGHFPCGWVGEWPQGRLLVF